MVNTKLSEINSKVKELAVRIGAPKRMFPVFGLSEHNGRPRIEVDEKNYHYVIAERGEEYERYTTSDIDNILYKIFVFITSQLSMEYELAHRVEGQDHRRMMFQRQKELLSTLSPYWAEQRSIEIEKMLEDNPYDNHASIRAVFSKSLRGKGYSVLVAEKMALDKYPTSK